MIEAVTTGVRGRGPDFTAIANRTSTTALSLKVFMKTSHHRMPNLIITPDQARSHPRRSELQSALGTKPEDLQISASDDVVGVEPGDAFLLCSDGLWEFVGDEAMEHALGGAGSPSAWLESLERLVREAARGRSSHDNFSAVAVWLVEPSAGDTEAGALGSEDDNSAGG